MDARKAHPHNDEHHASARGRHSRASTLAGRVGKNCAARRVIGSPQAAAMRSTMERLIRSPCRCRQVWW